MFDTHCHLYDNQYDEDRDEVIQNALSKGMKYMLVPSDSFESMKKCIELFNQPFIYFAFGVHPSEIEKASLMTLKDELKRVILSSSKVKAIGEIGLDYYWVKDQENHQLQKQFFKLQIELANELHLPIVVHSRDAAEDTLLLLEEVKPLYGCVFHCFSYSEEILKIIIKRGYYIGLDGPVTYKNAKTPKEVAKIVPLDRLLLETDCPYLTPSPFRGKRNEPQFIEYIIKEIACLRNISMEEVIEKTCQNGKRFFNIGD